MQGKATYSSSESLASRRLGYSSCFNELVFLLAGREERINGCINEHPGIFTDLCSILVNEICLILAKTKDRDLEVHEFHEL